MFTFMGNHRVRNYILLLFLTGISCFGLGQEETPVGDTSVFSEIYPLTLYDDLNQQITLNREPQSIASLTLFSDEILFSLISPERLSAVTFLAADPVYSNIAKEAEAVEHKLDLNVEKLIELYPDIIFAADWSDKGKVEQLRQAGLQVYQISTVSTVIEIEQQILKIGGLLGVAEKAQELVLSMEQQLAELELIINQIPEESRLTAMDYNSWNASSGADSSWNEILLHAGLINPAAARESDPMGQVPMSRELLVELNPDVLFLPGWIFGDPEGAEKFKESVMKDPALKYLSALENDRVFLMPEYLKSTYSQYIVYAAWYAARLAYPQWF